MSYHNRFDDVDGMRRVAFRTLGCKLNFSETSTIARDLAKKGFERVRFSEEADLYVINTCSVTGEADRKCRKVIRQAVRRSPNALVAVTGCYAQLKPEEIGRIPGVDLVLGTVEKLNLPDHLDSLAKRETPQIYGCETKAVLTFQPSLSLGDRTRSFLKVQDGCDYNCCYCTIPKARGQSRSDSIKNILDSARRIAEAGVKEIVLSGVNVGDFGRLSDESFLALLEHLDLVDGLDRIRISSIEPNLLTDEIISFVAISRLFVPHFHLPLQSGSNSVLKSMKRRYNREMYAERVDTIKSLMPDCCIGADVMVGFPGETEKDFIDSCRFISDLDLSYLHVFTYSERSGTTALDIPGAVSSAERAKRSRSLHRLSREKRDEFYEHHLNRRMDVLFETHEDGLLSGLTRNYVRVRVPGPPSLGGDVCKVMLISNESTFMRGELVN